MATPRIILPTKRDRLTNPNVSVIKITAATKPNTKPETVTKRLPPVEIKPPSEYLFFEIGSVYKCLTSFTHKFTTFHKDEILQVIGNRKEGKSSELQIIFANYSHKLKKFWNVREEDKHLSKNLFQKIE